MLFALAGWFVGFDGSFHFDSIGDSYTENNVPYVGMRALAAIFGSLTIPVVYAIMKESGFSTLIAAFSAALILFGMLSELPLTNERVSDCRFRQRPHCPVASYPA